MGAGRWLGFEAYRRQADDACEYRAKRLDIPRDSAKLLELVRIIELEDTIIVDREHAAE